ncbi:hypothetical protein SK128_020765 [Halocaridina rubra]|uniref:C2 domain-containing protein n=1 Tax=Halocaridina rubra TaxID=373956 RepID=A0AAN8ZX43_HALRR
MAPNILRTLQRESEESSQEELPTVKQPTVEGTVSQVPEIFLSHLPQQFQNPDSPNLHQISPADRIVLEEESKTFSPSRTPSPSSVISPLQPNIPRKGSLEEQILKNGGIRITQLDESIKDDTLESSSILIGTSLPQREGFHSASGHPSRISQIPDMEAHGRLLTGNIPNPPQAIPSLESDSSRQVNRTVKHPESEEETLTTTTASTTVYVHQHGVLKIPGHAPEAPADLNLTHHDRTIDVNRQTGEGGIIVKNDPLLTPQEATTLILVGLCSVFLVFICLVMFIKKIRRENLQKKVAEKEVDSVKSQPRYEATAYSLHPNPLSLLPPDILRALMQPLAGKAQEIYEEPVPSFLAMEPPEPGNQLGRLWFSVFYDYVKATLVLRILHARYVKGRGSTTNPGEVWVEACVLTSMNTIKASNKTDKRRASLAPIFNQNFTFRVDDEEVTQLLLRLTLYDIHPQNGEKPVGSVIVPLSAVDLCSSDIISRDLQ